MLVVLPPLCFAFIFLAVWRRQLDADPRPAFLSAAIISGVITAAISEVLSFFNALTTATLGLAWALASLCAAVGALRCRQRSWQIARCARGVGGWGSGAGGRGAALKRSHVLVLILVAPIVLVAFITGFLAIVGWPSAADAMVYHLSRVAHWAKNQSVAFYPTHVQRQLFFPPWAEYAILHLTLLSGMERAANLVQWLSMLGSLVGVSVIAKRLGADGGGQLFSAVFCATLPMGIIQASSTQNDYVPAFWLVCLANALLVWRIELSSIGRGLAVGASLGLALLTKATAYIFAAPILLVFLLAGRASASPVHSRLRQAALSLLFALALLSPQYYRNFELYGWALGPVKQRALDQNDMTVSLLNETFTPAAFTSNLVRNVALHIGTPSTAVNSVVEEWIRAGHSTLGLNPNDPRTTWGPMRFEVLRPAPAEERAPNPLHLLLVLAALLWLMLSRSLRQPGMVGRYALGLLLGFLLFSFLLKWQGVHSRLHLPLFVLWSPVVGLALQRQAIVLVLASLALTAGAWPSLVESRSHPLIGEQSVLRTNRIDQYFLTHPSIQGAYVGAARFVSSTRCRQVGLLLTWDDWEYPFWALLPDAQAPRGRLEHVSVTNESARLEPRQRPFRPCAVIAVRGPDSDTLSVGEGVYRRAWSSTELTRQPAARRVEVFLPGPR